MGGGDCSLIRQFQLEEELVVPGVVSEVDQERDRDTGDNSEPSYSETVKNRNKGEMTADSERFHEMSSASESPPKTAFLLDDDGEFHLWLLLHLDRLLERGNLDLYNIRLQ